MGSVGTEQTESQNEIPIIDFSPFINSNDPAARLKTAQALVSACKRVGFVYIVNHGLPQSTLDQAFAMTKHLYGLPKEQKMLAPHPPGFAHHRGYSHPGLEKVYDISASGLENDAKLRDELRNVMDFKESYEIGNGSFADMPNIWLPESVLPGYRDFMLSFYHTLHDTVGANILKALALGIGLEDEDHLLKLHTGLNNQLRLLHYPAISAKALETGGGKVRMPAHTDWSSMTFLFQDDCGGLQVESPSEKGKFIDVAPIPVALVMNIGDLMTRWSNDMLKSTYHRVTLPPQQDRFTGDERMTKERYSIVYFMAPDPDLVIETMPSCVDEGHPSKYEPITQRDYVTFRARMQY